MGILHPRDLTSPIMQRRIWIRSGIVEELDQRQLRLLDHVYRQIQHYYSNLHNSRPCYRHPLNLSRLVRLTNRSGAAVISAVRLLSHTIPDHTRSEGSDVSPVFPLITYTRIASERNASHRPYRIFLRAQDAQNHDDETQKPNRSDTL